MPISARLFVSVLAVVIASSIPASAGTIRGHVRLAGLIPKQPTITMTADPACDKISPQGRPAEMIVAAPDGALANVIVHITRGLPKKFAVPPAPPGEVRIDQKGCVFVPHVIGVRVGQEVAISSSDETMHNVASRTTVNTPFNELTPGAGSMLRKVFMHPELPVKLKCDIHPWMVAYVGVFDHPFFAVTGPDGAFSISGLPEAEYSVEAWHESLGVRAVAVELEDDDATVTTDFSFVGN